MFILDRHFSLKLLEATRQDLISKSRSGANYSQDNQMLGKNRWERKRHSRVATSTREYNSIDMNSFFKKDVLNVIVPVQGETDNYKVKIRFSGVLDEIQKVVKQNNNKLDYRTISQALSRVFNSDKVYVHCSCPDWQYRMAYFSTINDFNSGAPERRPSNETNPNDTLGGICKHTALVLSNLSWMMKVASVINNYIHFAESNMQRQFADIIFPKIYGVKYPEAIQLGMFDRMYLKHSKGVIDAINEYGKKRGRFSKKKDSIYDNEDGDVKMSKQPKQLSIFDKEIEDTNEEDTKLSKPFKQQSIYDFDVEEPEDNTNEQKGFSRRKEPKIKPKAYKKLSIFDDEEEKEEN